MHTNPVTLLLLVALLGSGCYLGHLASGQARLLRARRPIEALLRDPSTDAELRDRLELVRRARTFATELGLEVGGQYTSYVPWPGDRVVTIVVTTRPGELEPAGFSFPIVGRVPYKGFFDLDRAAAEAERQRARGYDVCQVGVAAYSSLGWFDDPVTGPMLRGDPGEVVETVLHELLHATVYAPDHARFNEGVASFLGQEGSVRFYEAAGDPVQAAARRERVSVGRRLRAELSRLRGEIETLYAGASAGDAEAREALVEGARARIAGLDLAGRDAGQLAGELRLNDACLALSGTYSGDIHHYAALLAHDGGDLRGFLLRVKRAAEQPDPRAALLASEAARPYGAP